MPPTYPTPTRSRAAAKPDAGDKHGLVLISKIHGSLADDGVGFDPAKVTDRDGIGLITMEERIRRLGGHLSIESAPGKGTRIFLAAPLNIPAAERQL